MNKRNVFIPLAILFVTVAAAACKPTATPPPPTVPPTEPPPTVTPVPPTPVPPTDTPTVAPTPAPIYFTNLDMITANAGWALTDQSVLRTLDGGTTWTNVDPSGWSDQIPPTNGFFLDANLGWLVQSDPVDFEKGKVFRTVDGGTSWKTFDTAFGAGALYFLDAQNGWILSGLGAGAGSEGIAIFATQDGGATWVETYRRDTGAQEPAGEIPLSGIKQGIAFRDLQHGWVGGSVPADDITYLYATDNGGSNFHQQNLTLPSSISTAMLSLDAPIFHTTTAGVLPVYLYTATQSYVDFYTTIDGGVTWTPTIPVPSLGRFSAPTMTDFFVWDGTVFYRSSDGGITWQEITPNISLDQMVGTLDFIDGQNGWVTWVDANNNSGLYRTTDGGSTWTAAVP